QNTVGRQRTKWLAEVEPVAKVVAFAFLAFDDFGVQQAGVPQVLAHVGQQVGVFGIAFRQDVAGAVESRFGVIDRGLGIQIAFGRRGRVAVDIGQNGISQRLKAGFACNLGACTPLGLVGRIQVFQTL